MADLQNTGNPVLDSLVNIVASNPNMCDRSQIVALHGTLLELAAKEPGGLRRPNHMPAVVPELKMPVRSSAK